MRCVISEIPVILGAWHGKLSAIPPQGMRMPFNT